MTLATARRLSGEGLNVSASPPSSTPVDATARHLPPVVRISPHPYSSEEEVARVVEAMRGMSGLRAG